MKDRADVVDHRDRKPVLVIIGLLVLLMGLAAAFLGPVEMYCFYLFSEGGRFHYEGFGFGSFMFGNIASQIVGYYLIAILLVPLGYGHLKVRRWARTLSLTLLWSWLVLGIPLTVVLFFVLLTTKELSLVAVGIAAVGLLLSYLVVPGVLIWFYRSRDVRLTFQGRDPKTYWVARLPMANLVLSALYSFYIVVLHIAILFNGFFPLFGVFRSGIQGIALLDVSIVLLACLIWGTLRSRPWAWWGSLFYVGLMALSSILTFSTRSYADMLSGMRFAPTEMEALQGLPFQGVHFAVLIGLPLLATLGVIVFSRRHFTAPERLARDT